MCMSAPKIPDPPLPPKAPPPPTAVARSVENKALKSRDRQVRRRGISALTIRRPRISTINTGSTGSGANIY